MAGIEVTQLEHNHPLFLHASNAPGLVLVPIKLTGQENYALWSRAMKLALRGKSKLGFVDKSCMKNMYRGELAEQWEKCNAIVLSWIGSKVANELIPSIMFASSAKKVWRDFKERFDRCSLTRVYQLWTKIASLRHGMNSVTTYYSKMNDLWNELDILAPKPGYDCEESRPSLEHLLHQRLLQFLMGLSKSYSNVRSNVLMKRPVVSVNEAYAIVTQEESQRALGVADMNKDLLTMMAGRPQYNKPKKIGMVCEHCGYKCHLKENCYNIVGYPTDFKSKKKTHVAGGGRTFASNANAEDTSNSKSQSQGHYLTQEQYQQIVEQTYRFKGLYSVNVLGIDREHEGLYVIKQMEAENKALVAETITKENAETVLWHYRMGHASIRSLQHLSVLKNKISSIETGNCDYLRSDNGTEFCNTQCDSLFASYGIIHQTSCPYKPQQNDTERKHRHILEVARAFKFRSGVPIRFWGDCVKTAVYVINRLPTLVLKGRTPYELLYGKEPKVDHLRVFGCQCHTTTLPKGDKFAPRARKAVFISYSETQKGYRLYDLEQKSFFVSRDVVFQEGRFPFKDTSVESDDMFLQQPISAEEYIPSSPPIQAVGQEDTTLPMNRDAIDSLAVDDDLESEEVEPISTTLEQLNLPDTQGSTLGEVSGEVPPVEPVSAPTTTDLPAQPTLREPR
ncbi:PREDICTED: uncharacterized protein LOC109214527 [Nicotiana attenuata]|uniref:uncharacterized protein LOC109214527 n=1 Tax=Nicotiana attenuata TaxID=49451 RepID=UPI000905046F|nr:PREDICTED: uncharacterized protein LOC109214527 [Nicotiana attenuata]